MSYTVSAQAQRDLIEIRAYIAAHAGERTADRIDVELHEAMEVVGRNPAYGHARDDLPRKFGYRVLTVYSYVIVYRIVESSVVVVRVIHGSRDFRRLFRRP